MSVRVLLGVAGSWGVAMPRCVPLHPCAGNIIPRASVERESTLTACRACCSWTLASQPPELGETHLCSVNYPASGILLEPHKRTEAGSSCGCGRPHL